MIITAWYLLSETVSPALYHKVPVLVFEVLQMLWWLAAWPSLAWAASVLQNCSSYYFLTGCSSYPLLASAAALAAVEWHVTILFYNHLLTDHRVLFIATMVTYSQHFHASQPTIPDTGAAGPETEMHSTYDPKLHPQHTGTTFAPSTPTPQYASTHAASVPQYAPAAPQGVPQFAAATAPAHYAGVQPVYSPPPAQQPLYPPPAQQPSYPPPGHVAPVEAPGSEISSPQSPPVNHAMPAMAAVQQPHEVPGSEVNRSAVLTEAPISDATTTTSPAVHP
jgi:hypothetical protein